MAKLKPCPFCGGNPEKQHTQRRHDFADAVECQTCEVFVTGCEGGGTCEAHWNRRPVEDALSARVRELEAVIKQDMSRWAEENEESTARLNLYRKEKARADALGSELVEAIDRVERLEAKFAEARAAAVQWHVYGGTWETLPGIGMTVLFDGADGVIVVYYRSTPEGRSWEHYEIGCDGFPVEIGDRWAYLPTPLTEVKE